jgi:YesN/AraC family two-component response regulator
MMSIENFACGRQIRSVGKMSEQTGTAVNKGKLLIVDDEPDFVESLEWQLTKRGYEVQVALSGDAALDVLRSERIDILIADIRMPGMDGIELIRRAGALAPDLQSIVITGHGGVDTAIEAMRIGAINYLRKPVGVEELDVSIQKGIEKRDLIFAVRERQERLEKANHELRRLRDQLEKSLEREIEQRKQAQEDLHAMHLRQRLVEAMTLSLRCWKQTTQKTKIDLAEESAIWKASVDADGTYRTRTLDRYLKLVTLPANPRVNDVLDTAYFVLSKCSGDPEMKTRLEEKINDLEGLVQNTPSAKVEAIKMP